MISLARGRYAVETAIELPRLLYGLGLMSWSTSTLARAAGRQDWSAVRDISRSRAARILDLFDVDLDVSGLEHIDTDEQYVIVPLHESFVDVLVLTQLGLSTAWVARDELVDTPGLDTMLGTDMAQMISPESPRAAARRVFDFAPDVFASGRSLVMFPQGTLLGIEAKFYPGAFQVAERFGRPVLPVVIAGSHMVYGHPFSPTVRSGMAVRVEVLPSIGPADAMARLDAIESQMRQIALAGDIKPRSFDPDRDGFWDGYAFEIAAAYPALAQRVRDHRQSRAT